MTQKERVILDTARRLFLCQGCSPLTMEGIAREAGVSKTTLYKYFPDKEKVVVGVMQSICDEIRQELEKLVEKNRGKNMGISDFMQFFEVDRYRHFFQSDFIKDAITLYPAVLKQYMEWSAQTMFPLFSEFFQQAKRSGVLRKDVDPAYLLMYLSMFSQASENMIRQQPEILGSEKLQEAKKAFSDMFLHGILAKE